MIRSSHRWPASCAERRHRKQLYKKGTASPELGGAFCCHKLIPEGGAAFPPLMVGKVFYCGVLAGCAVGYFRRGRFRACGRDQRAFRSPFGNLRGHAGGCFANQKTGGCFLGVLAGGSTLFPAVRGGEAAAFPPYLYVRRMAGTRCLSRFFNPAPRPWRPFQWPPESPGKSRAWNQESPGRPRTFRKRLPAPRRR